MVVQKAESDVEVLGYARSMSDVDGSTNLTGGLYTYNATGGSIVSERSGTGAYKITFAGLDFSVAHPKVSGLASKKPCGITQWGSDWVKIGCYDSSGAAADSLFSVVVVE